MEKKGFWARHGLSIYQAQGARLWGAVGAAALILLVGWANRQ